MNKTQKILNIIEVNDIFDDLSEENKRLENELIFANNCLKILNQFKDYLNKIYLKFETLIDSEDKQQLDRLEDEFNSLIKPKEQTIDSNVSIDVNTTEEVTENCEQLSEDMNNEKELKTVNKSTIILNESNDRKSGRTERKLYLSPVSKTDQYSKPKSKYIRKVIEIPDPEVEPNSLLLMRRNTFDEKIQRYVCPNPFCDKSNSTKRRLYQHFRNSHCLPKKYFCNICNKRFKHSSILKKHSKTHSDFKPFGCDIDGCDRKFKTTEDLINHKLVHTNKRDYICDECGKTYKRRHTLSVHKKIHSIKPAFKCCFDDCNQMFASQHYLIKHKIISHNLKPKRLSYSCDWPGCEFNTMRAGVFKHHKTLHTGEKPFVCEWPGCTKRFRIKQNLRTHLLVHKDLKPVSCIWPGCQYRCRTTGNLGLHMKVHQK